MTRHRRQRPSTVPARRPGPAAHGRVLVRPHASGPATPAGSRPPTHDVERVLDEGAQTLVDVIDNLLNRGIVLNADVILALANVDLVYVRLSAILCAADRVGPRATGRRTRRGRI